MNEEIVSDHSPSPFHQGEQKIQERLGVREKTERFGRRVIRDYMPDQHREFFQYLPYVFVGHVDQSGWPWASILFNRPGFIQSSDDKTLSIAAKPIEGDPLSDNLYAGSRLGLLGIELASRRRNRLAVHVIDASEGQVKLEVDQSFGNCPQYIQSRELVPLSTRSPLRPSVNALTELSSRAQSLIEESDTFFVASYFNKNKKSEGLDTPQDVVQDASEGADVSHRGGKPGFVRVDDNMTLTIPDYLGNNHFNTFGNFEENGKAGLLFFDFENGHVLTLTGSVEILWDSPDLEYFEGAQRLWRFHLSHGTWIEHGLPLRWRFEDYSPNTLLTGSWQEADNRRQAEAMRDQWQSYEISNIVNESAVIKSFYLKPKDSVGVPSFKAGQFLTVKLIIEGRELVRTYTVSSAPADTELRISVKRETATGEGFPNGVFSNYVHNYLELGSVIQVKAPAGGFTFDASQQRPAVLLAAGVGLTPMVSMARHALIEGVRTRSMRRVTLISAARNVVQRAFFDELNNLVERSAGNIKTFWCLSQADESLELGRDYHHLGRISKEFLQAVLPVDDYDFYLCGPGTFMQSQYDLLRDLGIKDSRIFAEAFGPAALKRKIDLALVEAKKNPAAKEAIIEFADSKLEQAWSASDGNLLEFAEAHGLSPEYGCRSGQCGACKAKVTEGRVVQQIVSTFPLEEDEALLCCSVPAAESGGGETLVKLQLQL